VEAHVCAALRLTRPALLWHLHRLVRGLDPIPVTPDQDAGEAG
jgi:hypothetical protein